ncbi:MAG: T9SS type A sorting domain-containing protein [Calditrichaeota bacterium]|nr:T9SS type A sorting domain-containing protein [Calditrichota bacterium]
MNLMRYTIIMVLSIVVVIAAGVGGELCAQEWSEPVELTNSRNEHLENEYDTAVDSHGNIHLIYWVQEFQEQRLTHRLLYSKFDPHGNAIRERFLPIGNEFSTYYGRMIIDEEDNIHICCLGRDEDDEYQYWYTSFNQDLDYLVEPVIVEGLRYTSSWLGNVQSLHRTRDGSFVFTMLAYHEYDEVDSTITHWVSYARFNEEGELIGEPHYLFTRNPNDGRYAGLRTSLDQEDNLHLIWSGHHYLYSCISDEDEIITEPTQVRSLNNERLRYLSNNIIALNRNAIFFTAEEEDTTYLIRMDYRAEPLFYTTLQDGGLWGTNISSTNDIISITGLVPNNRSYDYYYASIDTVGSIVDSSEIIRERPNPGSNDVQIIRAGDTLSVFNFRRYEYPEYGIEMVQKVIQSQSIFKVDELFQPEYCFIDDVHPNPFNSTTTIRYKLVSAADISLSVFDLTGRQIATLHQGHTVAGEHTVNWAAEDVPSGVYMCRLQAGTVIDDVKMVLIR